MPQQEIQLESGADGTPLVRGDTWFQVTPIPVWMFRKAPSLPRRDEVADCDG